MKTSPCHLLFLFIGGCISVQPGQSSKYSTRETPNNTTEITLREPQLQLELPRDDNGKEIIASKNQSTWQVGVPLNGWVRDPSVVIDLKPDATKLVDEEAVLRANCFGFEVIEEQSRSDGFGLLYSCSQLDHGFVGYIDVRDVGGRTLGCRYGGTAARARTAMKTCATLRVAQPTAPPTQTAAASR